MPMAKRVLQQNSMDPGQPIEIATGEGLEVRDHGRTSRMQYVNRNETNNNAARNSRPAAGWPLQLLTTPSMYGPTKPPRLPIELIAAMETAAVERVRNKPGNAQKGDLKAYSPASATEINATETTGWRVNAVQARAHAASTRGRAE